MVFVIVIVVDFIVVFIEWVIILFCFLFLWVIVDFALMIMRRNVCYMPDGRQCLV
jgi:hypothetical protein